MFWIDPPHKKKKKRERKNYSNKRRYYVCRMGCLFEQICVCWHVRECIDPDAYVTTCVTYTTESRLLGVYLFCIVCV